MTDSEPPTVASKDGHSDTTAGDGARSVTNVTGDVGTVVNNPGTIGALHIHLAPAAPSEAAPAQPERRSFEPETVVVPDGPFQMGSHGGPGVYDYEKPRHELALPAYAIGRFTVTNAEYLEFMRSTKSVFPDELGWVRVSRGQAVPEGLGNHPVVGVSWDDALAYCRWLSKQSGRGYRLPSEAEWEKAARGTDGRCYPWGDAFEPDRCNSLEAGVGAPVAVGSHSPAGDSIHGCSDMSGNVWEWTSTIWGLQLRYPEFEPPYQIGARDQLSASRPIRELRVCRGGSFQEAAERVTCTARGRRVANSRDRRHGFRVALDR